MESQTNGRRILTAADPPAPLLWSAVRPYISLTVLECEATNLLIAFHNLSTFLRTPGRTMPGRISRVVAANSQDDRTDALLAELGTVELGIDNLEGFVTQQQKPPAWAGLDTNFTDI